MITLPDGPALGCSRPLEAIAAHPMALALFADRPELAS